MTNAASVMVHGLHITKVHATGKDAARRRRKAGQWEPCPCDFCRHIRAKMDEDFLRNMARPR